MSQLLDNSEQLKACPFCGEKPSVFHQKYGVHTNFTSIFCEGKECAIHPMVKINRGEEDSRVVATLIWNHRPEEARLQAIIEAQKGIQPNPIDCDGCGHIRDCLLLAARPCEKEEKA